MAHLTYWYIQCPNDSDVYSIREQTRNAALAALAETSWTKFHDCPVRKVTVEYHTAFDLMDLCSCEGHHYWEA